MAIMPKVELEKYWSKLAEQTDDVSTSITQTWTDQAIKCYVINGNCNQCSIPRGNYSFDCQMNKVVPVLLKNLGKPEDNRIKKLLPYMDTYIDPAELLG
ncbi:MAG: hypothetical protein KTR14_05925 [Vampirovibrio sp.]|nr:hypothetical protein [Vampirovibrio sp.]